MQQCAVMIQQANLHHFTARRESAVSKAACLRGPFLPVVALTDLTRLNWDQRGAALGRDADAIGLSSLVGEPVYSLKPPQANLTQADPVTLCDSEIE